MIAHDPVRLAILGAGTIGTVHGLCSLESPESRVSAVWSVPAEQASALAGRLDTLACASLDEAVSRPDVDAVLICTPTFLHAEHALAAIRAGKHVFCEKPLARDMVSARKIADAARDAGVLLFVGHVVRFFPEFCRLHDAVQQGVVGQPALVRMSRNSSYPRGVKDWHNNPALSGGAVLDMAIHDLDWLLWTFGPAERVYARGLLPQRIPFLDYALITVRFRNGVLAHVETSWAEAEGFHVEGEVSGDGGLLTYDSDESTALRVDLRQPPLLPPGVVVPTAYTAQSPYVLEQRHFARCIQGLEQPLVTPEQACDALQLALAALDSVSTGQPVAL
jgi:predicted dehydrogenase